LTWLKGTHTAGFARIGQITKNQTFSNLRGLTLCTSHILVFGCLHGPNVVRLLKKLAENIPGTKITRYYLRRFIHRVIGSRRHLNPHTGEPFLLQPTQGRRKTGTKWRSKMKITRSVSIESLFLKRSAMQGFGQFDHSEFYNSSISPHCVVMPPCFPYSNGDVKKKQLVDELVSLGFKVAPPLYLETSTVSVIMTFSSKNLVGLGDIRKNWRDNPEQLLQQLQRPTPEVGAAKVRRLSKLKSFNAAMSNYREFRRNLESRP